jgi:hypothetical protein
MRPIPGILVAVLCLSACVCTPPEEPAPAATVAPDTGTSQDTTAADPPANGPVTDAKEFVDVELTPLPDGSGYSLAGPENLTGTLAHRDGQWQLDAAFEFPTAGYSVMDLEVAVLKRLPEEVHITIPYQPPPIDALVAQMVTKAPVTWTGGVSRGATFKIAVKRIAPGTAAAAGL